MKRTSTWLTLAASCILAIACGDDTPELASAASSGESVERGGRAQVPPETAKQLRAAALSAMEDSLELIRKDFDVPAEFQLTTGTCNQVNAFYSDQTKQILYCEEMFEEVASLWFDPSLSEADNLRRVVGANLFIFFHEVGHGLADIFQLPVTGREEDAVDDFSTLVLISAELDEEAISAANFWGKRAQDPSKLTPADFLDEHSLDQQRFGAIICMIFGSNPQKFAQLASDAGLSKERQAECPEEFRQKEAAWSTLLEEFARKR